ncbi:MAG: tetratricopeptide repeat protein, partial [Acidobacteriota bacterium]
ARPPREPGDAAAQQAGVHVLGRPCDAKGLRVLAMAHLNLGDLSEALPVLRELARLAPRDEAVRIQLLAVSSQLEEIHIESGFETEAVERPTREELGIA